MSTTLSSAADLAANVTPQNRVCTGRLELPFQPSEACTLSVESHAQKRVGYKPERCSLIAS